MIFRFLCLLLLLTPVQIQAYEFGDGSLEIPEGFEGPVTQNMGQGFSSTVFTYPHDSDTGTLLQISAWNPGQSFPQMTDQDLKIGTEQYLLQFLSGVQRKRESFKKGEVEFIEVSGHPMAKIQWSGTVQGKEVHGVMYCLVYNSKIYSFHTQDFLSFEGKYTDLAVNAFEKMELQR